MISVCIATYNGERFIKEQIESILIQLEENDEIIISDDNSTDNTLSVIEEFKDHRIKIFKDNEFHSPTKNFEHALSKASGDYIFLADQDDIWLPNRVAQALKILKKTDTNCVICNRIIIDNKGQSDYKIVISEDFTKKTFISVLIHNPYMGCCMAFTRNHLDLVLPFPKSLPMHDLWIGLLAHKLKTIAFISEPLIGYRRHGGNVTTGKSPYSIVYRVYYRIRLLLQLYLRLYR